MKKGIILAALLLLTFGLSYGQDLMSDESLAHYIEALKAQKNGNDDKALDLYKKTSLIAPENKNLEKYIANNMGAIYLKQNKLAEAEASFLKALKTDPNYLPAQMNLGLVYDLQQDTNKSTAYWRKVLNIDTDALINSLKPKTPMMEDGPSVPESLIDYKLGSDSQDEL